MRLGEKQELFMRLLPLLILKALEIGFQLRGGELLRDELVARRNASTCRRCGKSRDQHRRGHKFAAVGIVDSLHRKKLAIDFSFFLAGEYITDSHHPLLVELGEWWEKQNELCRWGGRFRNPDGGHFSLTHNGRA